MSSGHNNSKLSKKALPVVQSGRFSGRTMGIKKSRGVPQSSHSKKAAWYEGGPYSEKGIGTRYGTSQTKKNPDGRP